MLGCDCTHSFSSKISNKISFSKSAHLICHFLIALLHWKEIKSNKLRSKVYKYEFYLGPAVWISGKRHCSLHDTLVSPVLTVLVEDTNLHLMDCSVQWCSTDSALTVKGTEHRDFLESVSHYSTDDCLK